MENKIRNVAVNVWGVLDNELNRLHEKQEYLMRVMLETERHRGGRPDFQRFGGYDLRQDAMFLCKQIEKIHNVLYSAVETHDAKIQEKVAELALTSISEETKKP